MQTKLAQIPKKFLSMMLAVVLAVTMLPTFVLSHPDTAEAKDVAASDYWTILASTDFAGTAWTRNGDYNWYTNNSPTTDAGGLPMGWSVQFRDNEPEVTLDDGVKFWYNSGSDHNQGVMYMSSYNSQTSNGFFSAAANGGSAVTSFKVDLKFHLFGQTKANSGYDLSSRRGENVFFKLCENDSKYKFESRYSYNYVYYAQESYGRRHMKNNSDIYAASGTQDGGNYVLSTDKSYIDADADYHYIMYVADGWLCSYITDASGNVVISYDPIDVSSYSLAPADITGLFLNGSEFNFMGYEDFENVTYKSIEIYKGTENATLDTSKTKYLYTYFTGNSTNGESLHYAVSDDGIDFKPVNDGLPVWDSTASWSITQYPAGSTSGVATSKHVRDPYILNKRNTSTGAITSGYYILATDLNTQNGTNWGNNSKLLVYDVANLQNIDTTTPWVIDTTDMCASLTGGSVSRAWAPQAVWDNVKGKYMLYWSVGYVGGLTKLYYIYTSDFKTFEGTPKQLAYPTGFSSFIDADITYHNGIYYMFFKDEDNKKIYRAIAQRPNGPYQGFTKFSDTGMEGPQLYERVDGSYALMTDEYGTGDYHIYRASVPRNLNEGEVSTSNINYLSPRHGSVIRITPAEYNAIVSKFGTLTPNTVEYYWANDRSWGANAEQGTVMKDTAGHDFVSAWWSGGATVGGNKITLTNGAIYSTDNEMRQILSGDAYTIDFTFKSNGSTTKDDTHTIAAITNSDSSTYVCITTSGKFFVNGKEATYVDQSALTTALNASTAQRYRITFNGYATCLMVGDTYVGGLLNTTPMESSNIWLAFGLGSGSVNGNSIDTRLSGEWGKVTISPTATNTGHDDDFVNDLCSESDVAAANIKTFGADVYMGSNLADSNKVIFYSGNATRGEDDYNYAKTKSATVNNVVMVYDDTTNVPYYPMTFSFKTNGSGNKSVIDYCMSRTSDWTFTHGWYGFDSALSNNNIVMWPSSNNNIFGWEGGVSGHYYEYNFGEGTSNDSRYCFTNTSTHRVVKNVITFNGTFGNDEYKKDYTDGFTYEYSIERSYTEWFQSKTSWGTPQYTLDNDAYVLNYLPIKNILKSSSPTTIDLDGAGSLPAKNIREVRDYIVNGDGKWMYTPASKAEALRRLAAVGDVNPNSYDYASDVSGNVSACATAIKNAYDNFVGIPGILVKRTFTINYKKYGNVNTSEVVTAGNALNAADSYTGGANYSAVTSNTAPAHINGSLYHWEYSWTSSNGVWDSTQTPSASHVPHSNETYVETRGSNAVHCESLGTDIPSDPGLTYDESTDTYSCDTGWTHHNGATSDDNGYCTSLCTVCTGSEKVWDAHDAEWEEYCTYVDKVGEDGAYTSSSRTEYASRIASTTSGVDEYDETKSKSFIDGKNSLLETYADTYLNPLAEYSLLADELEDKSATRNTNNVDESGHQIYTYSTWINFGANYLAGDNLLNTDYTAEQKANHGKYTVNDGTNTVNNGKGGRTTEKSSYQNAIETDCSNISASHTALAAGAINNESFVTYVTAKSVLDASLDPKKFTARAISDVASAESTADAALYHTLEAGSDVTNYNTYTGGGYAAGATVINATSADSQTVAILGVSNDINNAANKATYINTYNVNFTVQTEDDTSYDKNGTASGQAGYAPDETLYYGDSVTLTVPSGLLSGRKVSNWSTSHYDYENPAKVDGSQKASGSLGSSYEKVVSGKMAVVAELIDTNKEIPENTNRFDICDGYGHLIDVVYSSGTVADGTRTATINFASGDNVTAKSVPMYSFDHWAVSTVKSNHYKLVPNYTGTPSYNYTFVGADALIVDKESKDDKTAVNTVPYDTLITVSSNDEHFAAWAVRTDAGKYQIASYNSTATFYACANENYVAIVSDGGNYKTKDASPVTIKASLIDGDLTDLGDSPEAAKNALVNNKIANHKPFIAIQNVKMTSNQARVMARVTQGSEGTYSYGVLIYNGYYSAATPMKKNAAGLLTRNVTSAISTGQFSYTLTTTKVGGFANDNISFRAFTDYTAVYNVDSTNYNINGTDYSAMKIATKEA